MDEWTTMDPVRCGGCTALAEASRANEKATHPGALRYIVGLREGWQERRAQRAHERAVRAG